MKKNRISLFVFNNLKRIFGEKRRKEFDNFIEVMNYDCEEDPSNVY
jgi:hypothetical protein